jgi:hypothetical protein
MTALTVLDSNSTPQTIFRLPYIPLGYQQITSLVSAQPLTVPGGAIAALIMCEIASVRYRDDGVNPTAGVGMIISPGSAPLLYAGNLSAIAFIQISAGAVLDILYYK